MSQDIHCPMLHGGLNINLKKHDKHVFFNHCCQKEKLHILEDDELIWTSKKLTPSRELNNKNIWNEDCWWCQGNELSNLSSFRTATLSAFGKHKNLSGPKRIDMLFDVSCNLACRTCGPKDSTFWQKHLKENNIKFPVIHNDVSRADDMIKLLKTLDLSNLEQVQFCGGETLMGNNYWRVADTIASLVPNAKEKLTIAFQTNGTQTIDSKNYEILEKFKLVKIDISIDGTYEKFNYLRWPADWAQVTENILQLKEQLPVNVMFMFEETYSILNLFYYKEVEDWVNENFSTNRLGDLCSISRHPAINCKIEVTNLTNEYVEAIKNLEIRNLIPNNWQENPEKIREMISEIEKFDKIRKQNWRTTFPEVAEFYSRYF